MQGSAGTPVMAIRARPTKPVFNNAGRTETEMYPGFNAKAHYIKRTRRNGTLLVNGEPVKRVTVKRTRRAPAPVTTRSMANTVGYTAPVGRKTAAELGITKVLIKYGE